MQPVQILGVALFISSLATSAFGADIVASGRIKSINAESKTFVLTNSANEDNTFNLGTQLVVNRQGQESKSDLRVGDTVNVSYEGGVFTWTARYILVIEGTASNQTLVRGSVKTYDPAEKKLIFTSGRHSEITCHTDGAKVSLNGAASTIGDVKIGDRALLIVGTHDGESTLQSMMVERAAIDAAGEAGEHVSTGRIQTIDSENKTIVLVDPSKTLHTFKLADNFVVNRAGKETHSDLNLGDFVSICYDKGLFSSTVHYILVREGPSQNSTLIPGNIKGYDADKKQLAFTNEAGQESVFAVDQAALRINMKDARVEALEIGDHALLIVDTVDGKTILRSVMVGRLK